MYKLFEEIKELRNEVTLRSAVRIYSILNDNRDFFCSKMDKDSYSTILKGYESFAYGPPVNAGSKEFKEEYAKLFEALSYHLERIIY